MWIWGNKHRVGILLAVWEDQSCIKIDLSAWIKGSGFYQQLIWQYKDKKITALCDELISNTKLNFDNMLMGEARIILINI